MRVPHFDVDESEFAAFVAAYGAHLRRALTAARGVAGEDAANEALAWAWLNWDRVKGLPHPMGYLYRVGLSKSTPRRVRILHAPIVFPDDSHRAEPRLERALSRLPAQRRTALLLVHGYGWRHREVADLLGISRSSVGTHIERAMAQLRKELGVHDG